MLVFLFLLVWANLSSFCITKSSLKHKNKIEGRLLPFSEQFICREKVSCGRSSLVERELMKLYHSSKVPFSLPEKGGERTFAERAAP